MLLRKRLVVAVLLGLPCMVPADELQKQFITPPAATEPRCYWYWMDNRVTQPGITEDLEAMKQIGIGEAYIGIIGGQSGLPPAAEPKALSDAWWGNIEHAVRAGGRIGVDIGFFNSPGWSQSGGPWVKSTQAMRYVQLPELRLHGPQHFAAQLAAPVGEFQDIAVLAFPAPADGTNIARIAERTPTRIQFQTDSPFTARSLWLQPDRKINVTAELQASDDGRAYRTIKTFSVDRHNLSVQVGPEPLAPEVVSFPAVTARCYRLNFSEPCQVGEVRLSPAAKVEAFAEKSLLKVCQVPHPAFDFYTWPPPPEPGAPGLAIHPAQVRNLSRHLAADGTLQWDVPAGDWIVLRAVMVPTGTSNSPAPPEATGYEVDKMSRAALQAHFDAYVGELLRRMPASERTAWKHVVADSYEQGPENWTDGFGADFQRRYGYDPLPWLPVLTGRVVGSEDQSDRFLWDMRRLVADRIARDYVGGLRDLCHQHGLKMWLENYGHWGFPAEFLQYGGACDEISGEFWANGNYDDPSDFNYLGRIELTAAASAAHIYNKKQVWAEAFTGGPPFINTPRTLKARGDWALCQGITQFTFHVYIHQPWDDQVPGINAWFGTEFNRHNTWFAQGKAWVDYLRRCSVMLQAGQPVADVAYFISEDAPKMTGQRQPPLPAGRDYDYINAEVIEKSLTVKNGRLTLPFGLSYRVLVLPDAATMRPELLRKIRDLIRAGATVVGTPPTRSPSLENFPECDQQVSRLAKEIWGGTNVPAVGDRAFGQGRVIWGKSLEEVFANLKSPPDFQSSCRLRFKHRREGDTDIYFVANPADQPLVAQVAFRVGGKAPELWWPDSGKTERPAVFDETNGMTRLPLELGPDGSVFVVFRKKAPDTTRLVAVTRDGAEILQTDFTPDLKAVAPPATSPVQVDFASGGLTARVKAAGHYQFQFADGTVRDLTVASVPAPLTLTGPWQVGFAPGWGAPAEITFDHLMDWTTRSEPGIKYFSGHATYRKTFAVPADLLATNASLILDLGEVRDLAVVSVNGHQLGTLWHAPWRVDVTSVVRPGTNTLEIEVVNAWNNRLVGDAALPPAQRHTFLSKETVKPGTPLQPAGLLGPVSLASIFNCEVDGRGPVPPRPPHSF